MIKIFWDKGIDFTPKYYIDLVTLLREDSTTPYGENQSFMKDYAEFIANTENMEIRYNNEEEFVLDLIKCGLAIKI